MQTSSHWTSDLVVVRLAEAGETMLRLNVPRLKPAGFRSSMPQYLPDPDNYPRTDDADLRPSQPTAREVSRMDQAMSWIRLIPEDMVPHRRLVGARCLTSWRTGRPINSWRKLGQKHDISHRTAKAWHDLAIRLIVVSLNRSGLSVPAGGLVGSGPAATRISSTQLNRAVAEFVARGLAST